MMRTCDDCGAPLEAESACTACEVDADVRRVLRARDRIAWLYACARRVVRLARRYRTEEEPGSAREAACLQALAVYRGRIAELRTTARAVFGDRPGLKKADASRHPELLGKSTTFRIA